MIKQTTLETCSVYFPRNMFLPEMLLPIMLMYIAQDTNGSTVEAKQTQLLASLEPPFPWFRSLDKLFLSCSIASVVV